MVLTVKRDTHAYKGTVFFEGLVNRAQYWVWRGGIVPSEFGAYATNEKPNRQRLREMILTHGLFCAAVPTIYRRLVGLEVPSKGFPEYDGGIYAYFGGDAGFGRQGGYFSDVAVAFDADRAAAWARETRSCVLLGRPYEGVPVHLNGHTGVLLPSGYILQSVFGEGLHWARTVHMEAGYWGQPGGVMVHPSKWIETHEGLLPWARQL